MMSNYHEPVLLKESIDCLNVKKGEKYIDATLGDGGHTFGILKGGGEVLGIDVDPEAIKRAGKRLEAGGWKLEKETRSRKLDSKISIFELQNPPSNFQHPTPRAWLVRSNFSKIGELALKVGFTSVSGVIYDLGMSKFQLEESGRGFSFQRDEKLDMRMDPTLSVRAMDLINGLTGKELNELFSKLGEEKYARRIADAISSRRRIGRIKTTRELREIILKNLPRGYRRKRLDPATKVFQALRIAVNSELRNLSESLPRAVRLIKPQGRLVVISFHSLEDKIIKNYIKAERPKGLIKSLTEKPVTPSGKEIAKNPGARSAKMRVVEVIGSEVFS